MSVPINYLAVVIAAVLSIILGFLWYGPLFGKLWIKQMGFTQEHIAQAKKKGMTKAYLLMILGTLLMSYVLAHALVFAATYTKATGLAAGLMVGFWNWLGFIAPVTLASVIWEGKSWPFWALNNGYYLISLLLMGVVLALIA